MLAHEFVTPGTVLLAGWFELELLSQSLLVLQGKNPGACEPIGAFAA